MVLFDNSSKDSTISFRSQLANPTDRMLAFLIDLLVLLPVVCLATVPLLNEIKSSLLDSGNISQLLVFSVEYTASVVLLFSLLQVVFLFFWRATPGQKFLQLRVEGLHQKLTFFQMFSRAVGVWLSFLTLGIPLLEIMSHPLRQTFYDRISDSVVLTGKKNQFGPSGLEAQFVGQWMRTTSLLLLILFLVQGLQILKGFENTSEQIDSNYACTDLYKFKNQKISKLDKALSLYLVNPENSSCLQKQLNFENNFLKEPELAYLGAYLMSEDSSLRADYISKICETRVHSPECEFLKNKKIIATESLSLKILQARHQMENLMWGQALVLWDSISDESLLYPYVMKEYVRSYYSYNQSPVQKIKSIENRIPASVDLKNQLHKKFKERFGVQ